MTELPPLVVDAPTETETFAVGRGYKARISAQGLEFMALPGPALPLAPLHLQLECVRVGEQDVPLRTKKVADEGDTCTLDHGALRERFDLQPKGVEHSFHFATLPAREELTVRLAARTSLKVARDADGLRFGDGLHSLHYGDAVAIDSLGKRCVCQSQWSGEGLQITVPREFVVEASLPLVIDPLLWAPKTWALGTGTGANLSVNSPDIAFSQSLRSWLLVWRVQVATNDFDVYARRFDQDWRHISYAQGVDLSTESWTAPRVAWVAGAEQWHICGSHHIVGAFLPWGVSMRRWGVLGAIGPKLLLTTSAGPYIDYVAIGGNPTRATPGLSFLTWWTPTYLWSPPLRCAVVAADGSMSTPRIVPTGRDVQGFAVSKSHGGAYWLLVWHERVSTPANTLEYRGAFFDRAGNVVPVTRGESFLIASGVTTATGRVSVSSCDAAGFYMVSYFDPASASMQVRRVTLAGVVSPPATLSSLLPGWSNLKTAVETDGSRALVLSPDGSFVRAALLSYDSRTTRWRAEDDFLVPATLPVADLVVSSRLVGGSIELPSPFTLGHASADSRLSIIRVVDYQPGVTSSTAPGYESMASTCGGQLSIEHDGTPPRPGSTLRFALNTRSAGTGFVVGTPARIPLEGICDCVLGVEGWVIPGRHLDVPIPATANVVGVTIAVQGFTGEAGPCLGRVSLSDTIVAEIR